MNYYPHHIGDFNNATRHLTRVERSVYRDATELYYDTEKPLPLDIPTLERKLMCKTDEEKWALGDILAEFFIKTDEGYFQSRCDAEISKYRSNISSKAKAGRASAEARMIKKKSKSTKTNTCSTDVQQNVNEIQLTNNQEPVTSNHKPIIKEALPHGVLFYESWNEWVTHLKQKKKKLTEIAKSKQLKKLAELTESDAVHWINNAIEKNWQSIYEPINGNKNTKSQNPSQYR